MWAGVSAIARSRIAVFDEIAGGEESCYFGVGGSNPPGRKSVAQLDRARVPHKGAVRRLVCSPVSLQGGGEDVRYFAINDAPSRELTGFRLFPADPIHVPW